jgi:hypothetical protein
MNKKATAIQQAIAMVRSRIETIDETLMGKHTIHHLQQIERGLHELLEEEREQIERAYNQGVVNEVSIYYTPEAEHYYKETYKH